jgi:hypothetical protein
VNEKEARSKVAAYTWKHRNHVETASAERIEAYRYFEAKGFLAALSTNEASLKEKDKLLKALFLGLKFYGRHEPDCHEGSQCPGYCECGWIDCDAPHRIAMSAYTSTQGQGNG